MLRRQNVCETIVNHTTLSWRQILTDQIDIAHSTLSAVSSIRLISLTNWTTNIPPSTWTSTNLEDGTKSRRHEHNEMTTSGDAAALGVLYDDTAGMVNLGQVQWVS